MVLVAVRRRRYTGNVSDLLTDLEHAGATLQAPPATRAPRRVGLHGDAAAAAAWCEALHAEGIEAAPGQDAAEALVLFCAQRVAEHLATLRELRSRDTALPLVVVGPALRELDQVLALEMGADDAIDAEAGSALVAARLRALWRRSGSGAASALPQQLHFGRLALHLRERRVQLGERRIALTECEFEVLWLLALHAGRAVSRGELLQRLRGLPYQRIDRSIDCRVYRIRAKLGDATGAGQHIRTVRNCGYLFSPARW